jgi:hypothetical protein
MLGFQVVCTAAFWNKNATQFASACGETRNTLVVPGDVKNDEKLVINVELQGK